MMAEWYFTAWQGESAWVGLAKQEPFVVGHPVYEPGEVWFAVGDTEEEALVNIRASVLN